MIKKMLKTGPGIAGAILSIFIIAPLASELQNGEDAGSAFGVAAVFAVIVAILLVIAYKKAKTMPYTSSATTASPATPSYASMGIHVSEAEIINFNRTGILPNVRNTPVFLSAGEQAVYFCEATRIETKNRVVGKTASNGMSIRVAKGVTVRTGNSGGQSIYGDVELTHPGQFVVTTRRLVFVAGNKAFEERLENVSAVTTDGCDLQILTSSNNYALRMPIPDTACSLIRRCREQI